MARATAYACGTKNRYAIRSQIMDKTAESGFKPPYLSFQTFWAFLLLLSGKPLPPAIDRSLMDTKSGSDQVYLFSALRSFGLIGPKNEVIRRLQDFATATEAERKRMLGNWVLENYSAQMTLSVENATEAQLSNSFTEVFNITGADTKRKAITFFLHAARMAGIELSPHFKATRSGSGAPGVSKGPKAKKAKPKPPPGDTVDKTHDRSGQGVETKKVDLGAAGSATITLNVEWLKLPTPIMIELRAILDQFDGLAEQVAKPLNVNV